MAKIIKGTGQFPPPDRARLIKVVGIPAAVLLLFLILFFSAVITTGVTQINTGEIGVIINNLTGTVRLQTIPGTIIHLPLGVTQVHKFDSKLQTLPMSGQGHDLDGDRRPESGTEQIRIKSRDGSDVSVDAEITYAIDPGAGARMAREIGVDRATPDPQILIAYTRAMTRDELGKLSIDDVIDAQKRNAAVERLREQMTEKMAPFGIVINTIAIQNPTFNAQFEDLIKSRKSADQELLNQASAQKNALSNQELRKSEALRIKETTLREEVGKQRRRVIEAQAEAEERKRRAEGEAYRLRIDGERQRDIAMEESEAIRTEGLKQAEGLRELAAAYRTGGLGLVREALAAKYLGAKISGRPYSLASEVDRLRIEEPAIPTAEAGAAAASGSGR